MDKLSVVGHKYGHIHLNINIDGEIIFYFKVKIEY